MIITRSRKGNWHIAFKVCQLINRCVGLRSVYLAPVCCLTLPVPLMYLFAFLHHLFD